MTKKVFTKREWLATLGGLKKEYKLFVPAKEGDFHTFKNLDEVKRPDFEFRNTLLSPKSIVYPQSERMFDYSLDENDSDANILKETPKEYPLQAVVGIRPCDVHAFEIVKVNFDNPVYRDPWWVRRYESTILVGLGCNAPCATCFCTAMGGGPFDKKGLDVLLYDLGKNYLAEAVTDKGETFLKKAKGGYPVKDTQLKEAENLNAAALKKINAHVPSDKLKEKVVTELFNAPFWEELAFACINCGTCTFLCPTCWCFDIQDEVLGLAGDRIRNWDACMFPLFTLHGSGHNPRDKKVQRVRQRFMHKLKYYVDKYNNGAQCSGCGRCVRYCPVNIDIRHVFDVMNNF